MSQVKCVKRNKLGECIDWNVVGEELVAEFRKEEINCNKKLFEEWKDKFQERKIRLRLED